MFVVSAVYKTTDLLSTLASTGLGSLHAKPPPLTKRPRMARENTPASTYSAPTRLTLDTELGIEARVRACPAAVSRFLANRDAAITGLESAVWFPAASRRH